MPRRDLIIGLMSGTSLDGVDAVLVDFSSNKPVVGATAYLPYTAELRQNLLELHRPTVNEIHQAAIISSQLAHIYADVVFSLLTKAGSDTTAIAAIGCHGQTIRHQPHYGYSLQLNNPSLLVELTGITVIGDFRSRDIAAGGQGAPLVPAFHSAQFRHEQKHRAILNLGGIANLTNLKPDQTTSGFDCGPGNMLLDAWTQKHLGHSYDAEGHWAASGTLLPELLGKLLGHDFFLHPPPKSCGRELFNLEWLAGFLTSNESPADVQATLLALTVISVQQAIRRWCGSIDELYVCGGGAYNTTLLNQLKEVMPATAIHTTEALGLPPNWVEAVAFAWLAHRTLSGQSGNLPEVTGARGLRILGAIYPA